MQPDLSTAIVILVGVLLGIGALLFLLAAIDPINDQHRHTLARTRRPEPASPEAP